MEGGGDRRIAMDAESVVEILELLERASVRVWVHGGWGVDALLGHQNREHSDLDVILNVSDASSLASTLAAAGFERLSGGTAQNFVMADERSREVDAHLVEFDDRGYGAFQESDGRRWPLPPSAFAGEGTIASRQVRCLSPEAEVHCHSHGYEPAEKDLQDMERLQDRFGVVLPLSLCRQRPGGSPAA